MHKNKASGKKKEAFIPPSDVHVDARVYVVSVK